MALHTNGVGMTHYWPDDDEWTMYVQSGTKSLNEMFRDAIEKWPDFTTHRITVTCENIQTSNVGAIVTDTENDYTLFVVLSVPQETK